MDGPRLLKEWRASAGLSQVQAAELVGVRQPTWCAWETGKVTPHIEGALKIARVSGGVVPVEAWCSPDELAAVDAAVAARAGLSNPAAA